MNNQYAKTFTEEDTENMPVFPELKQLKTGPLQDFAVHEDTVRKLLLDLKTDKSPGPYNLHPRILKEAAEQLLTSLPSLFEMSISQAKMPLQWK